MKTIHIIRHAKSSWQHSHLSDVDRPLSQRGINDCKIMASHLIEAGWNHQSIYCSQAKRAQMTIAGIANALPQVDIDWQIDSKLYTFSVGVLLEWLSELSDDCNAVTLVGHNPALTDLINQLGDTYLDNLPTCAYIQLKSEVPLWQDITQTAFHTTQFLKPKMFK
ncbi:SixA phosphatase family protein [Marinicella litoralis]|uniref:Phosphohistidine phosphatase n=1 Tax=Marinicella litoralis TaxID=644220 RepID=A0A4R6XAW3_9GAMM|nr:histidine phosphatase family protein [Marinicella litoralis]TDR14644.1 phosphohistidine phosphatase [Marinicella litoralis]